MSSSDLPAGGQQLVAAWRYCWASVLQVAAVDAETPQVRTALTAPTPQLVDAVELAEQLDGLELLPYTDPRLARRRAQEAMAEALEQGYEDLWQRARLVGADAQIRQGELAPGARAAREIAAWASERGHRHLVARSNRVLSVFFARVGDLALSLEHAVHAVAHNDDDTPLCVQADHLVALAVALGGTGAFAAAREEFLRAEALAVRLGDVGLRLAVLNNLAYNDHLAGDVLAAMTAADRMLTVSARCGVALELTFVHTVATARLGSGRYAEAEALLQGALADPLVASGDDEAALPEVLLTLARLQRLQGQLAQARSSLERCDALCTRGGPASVAVQVLRERAELLAAAGDHRSAYEQFTTFHLEHQRLFCAERDARATALHAALLDEQARKDTDRFRLLSLRDPLTGLSNRRHLEDAVPALVAAADENDAPLSLALIDVDHFKQVNDSLSHEAGDQLLRTLADVLAGVAQTGALAARLGGDEFVLVLPGASRAQAVELCRQLQRRLTSLDTGPSISTSIGIAELSGPHRTLADLLAEADAHLYQAKRAGRARVVA